MTVNNSDIFNNFCSGNHSLTDAMLNELYARDIKFEGMSGLTSSRI